MIRFLLFSLLVTFAQTVFAQDYSLFHSKDTCTYNNEVEYPDIKLRYTSLIVDSSNSSGGINIQYFPNTLGRIKSVLEFHRLGWGQNFGRTQMVISIY